MTYFRHIRMKTFLLFLLEHFHKQTTKRKPPATSFCSPPTPQPRKENNCNRLAIIFCLNSFIRQFSFLLLNHLYNSIVQPGPPILASSSQWCLDHQPAIHYKCQCLALRLKYTFRLAIIYARRAVSSLLLDRETDYENYARCLE